MLLEGNMDVTAMPQDEHQVHIAIHERYNDHDLVNMHIQEHEALLRQQAGLPETTPPEGTQKIPEELVALAQDGQVMPVAPVEPTGPVPDLTAPAAGAIAPIA
jgi:hypothetical protein